MLIFSLTKELVGKSLICTRAPPTMGPINPLGKVREYRIIIYTLYCCSYLTLMILKMWIFQTPRWSELLCLHLGEKYCKCQCNGTYGSLVYCARFNYTS